MKKKKVIAKKKDITDEISVDEGENADNKSEKHKAKSTKYTPAYKKMLREADLKEYKKKN